MSKELIDGMLAAMGNGIVSHLTQLSGGKPVGVVLHVLHDDGQFSCTHNLPDEDYHGFMAAVVESNALDASAALDAQRAEALGEQPEEPQS